MFFDVNFSFVCLYANSNNRENGNIEVSMEEFFYEMPIPCAALNKLGNIVFANSAFNALSPTPNQSSIRTTLESYFELHTQFTADSSEVTYLDYFPTYGRHKHSRKLFKFLICDRRHAAASADIFFWIFAVEAEVAQTRDHLQRLAHEHLLAALQRQSAGELTTILSHELNQPLGTIINAVGVARKKLADQVNTPDIVTRALHLAQTQAEHASAVVTRMRDFVSSRQFVQQPCSIRDIIHRHTEMLRWDIEGANVNLKIELQELLPEIAIDQILIGQVLSNLITNALRAMKSSDSFVGQLTIRAGIDFDDRIIVRVIDNGHGISAVDQEKIFSPFFTTRSEGMGMGLSICRSILELHAGSLYLEHSDSNGSSFCFTIPTHRE
ncbi:Two-component sensor kinase [gamma proteobacterium HdN1]|nr:Two-component sensor kinase [gamma proteobacterium HdN1]